MHVCTNINNEKVHSFFTKTFTTYIDCWATQMKAGDWIPDTTQLNVCELLDARGNDFRIAEMKDPQVGTDYLSSK